MRKPNHLGIILTCTIILLLLLLSTNKHIDYRNYFSWKWSFKNSTLKYGDDGATMEAVDWNHHKQVEEVIPSPKFAYITQTEKCLPKHWKEDRHLGNETACDCHVFVLSYREPCLEATASYISYLHDTSVGWSGGEIKRISQQGGGHMIIFITFSWTMMLNYSIIHTHQKNS